MRSHSPLDALSRRGGPRQPTEGAGGAVCAGVASGYSGLDTTAVRTRMDAGISYTEFSYMLLQAYDFLELNRRHGVTLQMGASDQWGNITAGTELIRRTTGAEVNAITTPLVTTAAGTKFGKSEAG